MTILRTALDSGMATLPSLPRERAELAHTVAVYSRPGSAGVPTVIIEVADLHRNLLARSVLETTAPRETAADAVLVDSALERCGQWRIDPIHRHKRLVSMVTLRASEGSSDYELARSAARTAARTA